MFDYVEHSAKCYKCGNLIVDWQSKDAYLCLEKLDPAEVDSFDSFYDSCKKCGAWNEYKVIKDETLIKKEPDGKGGYLYHKLITVKGFKRIPSHDEKMDNFKKKVTGD